MQSLRKFDEKETVAIIGDGPIALLEAIELAKKRGKECNYWSSSWKIYSLWRYCTRGISKDYQNGWF